VLAKAYELDDRHRFSGYLEYPLTPRVLAFCSVPPPVCPLPPVTRQQLQLVLGVVVGAGGDMLASAALLLVLLLQRADPGLRAAFLSGPEASLLLSTLVNWGRHPGEYGQHGAPGPVGVHGQLMEHTWEGAARFILDPTPGATDLGAVFPLAASAAMVLTMCYLEPVAPHYLPDSQQQPALAVTSKSACILHFGTTGSECWLCLLIVTTSNHSAAGHALTHRLHSAESLPAALNTPYNSGEAPTGLD
jgi:hypothetical protein